MPDLISESSSELSISTNDSGNQEGFLEVVARASNKPIAATKARLTPSIPFGLSGDEWAFYKKPKNQIKL